MAEAMGRMYAVFVSGTTAPPVPQLSTASMPSSPTQPLLVSVGPFAMYPAAWRGMYGALATDPVALPPVTVRMTFSNVLWMMSMVVVA